MPGISLKLTSMLLEKGLSVKPEPTDMVSLDTQLALGPSSEVGITGEPPESPGIYTSSGNLNLGKYFNHLAPKCR